MEERQYSIRRRPLGPPPEGPPPPRKEERMITPEAAWSRLEPFVQPLPSEPVARRSAAWRVLAEGVQATLDVPGLDVSAMDGYALAGEVVPGQPLPVCGLVAAGDAPGFALAAGAAVRIMTGAPLPAAADRVVPIEASDAGRTTVTFSQEFPAGAHVRRRGEVVSTGAPILRAGDLLTPGALSLLATHGIERVACHRLPRVALIVTGNEVVPPERQPRPGELRDSHTDFLLAATAGLGIQLEPLGISPDDPAELRQRIARGLEADVLLLTGGVSMGELDFVEATLAELACRPLFDSVSLQPGKPLVAAAHPGGLVFGLPGNPASVMVGFWLFVRPTLRRLLGAADHFWQGALAAETTGELPAARDRDRFLPADLAFRDGRWLASPRLPRGSHDLFSYGHGTGLVRLRAGEPARRPGEVCEVLPLADLRLATER